MHLRMAIAFLLLGVAIGAQEPVAISSPPDDAPPPVDVGAMEIDFLTSYYSQDGEHSAVTGGIGTEEQTVVSPVIVLRWQLGELWSLSGTLGLDNITSASVNNMDNPDMLPGDGVSGASKVDQRTYGTINATRRVGENNFTLGIGGSTEFDYLSFSGGLGWSRDFAQKNTTIAAGVWQYEDTIDHYDIFGLNIGEESRSTTALSATLTQVLGRRTVALLDLSASLQSGFLSTSFQEVILSSGEHVAERLPDSRDRYAAGVRVNHAFSSSIVQKAYFRRYDDDWDVSANTIELETHFRLPTNQEMWLFPILRWHDQTGSSYFGLPGEFDGSENFFTADRDLSTFTSEKYGVGWKLLWGTGNSGPLRLERLELRLTGYSRDDGLDAITTAFDFGWRY